MVRSGLRGGLVDQELIQSRAAIRRHRETNCKLKRLRSGNSPSIDGSSSIAGNTRGKQHTLRPETDWQSENQKNKDRQRS
jgi:hypothetical protein